MSLLQDLAGVIETQTETVSLDMAEPFELVKLGEFALPARKNQRDSDLEVVELVRLVANNHYKPHLHKYSEAMIYIIAGQGELLLGEEKLTYQPGMRVPLPKNVAHGFVTDTETVFLSRQSPPIYSRKNQTVDLHYV